jgi:hypothetical protein
MLGESPIEYATVYKEEERELDEQDPDDAI